MRELDGTAGSPPGFVEERIEDVLKVSGEVPDGRRGNVAGSRAPKEICLLPADSAPYGCLLQEFVEGASSGSAPSVGVGFLPGESIWPTAEQTLPHFYHGAAPRGSATMVPWKANTRKPPSARAEYGVDWPISRRPAAARLLWSRPFAS